MSDDTESSKKVWTEQERLELAAKLDAELDDFIAGLEKKRYAEGWPEDRWQEEMDKHPFFMKKAPQPGDEVHPMFEGLQKLKYDPQENTNEELALNYKEDGNFYMKHKKYRMAVYSFTEGLKANCTNPEVLAVLYNNRSAAHFFLKNYRSALNDAMKAYEYKPNYIKAMWRAAQCAHNIDKFDTCTEICEALLQLEPERKEYEELMKANKLKKLTQERDARQEMLAKKRKEEKFIKLCSVLKERGVKFAELPPNGTITEELLKPKYLPLEDCAVWLQSTGMLVWPVAFQYPEFLISEFERDLPDIATIEEVLFDRLKEPLPCDEKKIYRHDTVNVYYENPKAGSVHKINIEMHISEILKENDFYVIGGALLFYVVPKGSDVEKQYLAAPRKPTKY